MIGSREQWFSSCRMEQRTISVGGHGFPERGMDAEHDGGVDEWIAIEGVL
jgi:hypothetical protein